MSKDSEINPKKSKRRFLNLSNVSKYLYCSICQDIFNNPTRISCGHTFCHECISKWSKTKRECPICRNFFSSTSLQKDLIGLNMVNELEVYCLNAGCPWKSTLQNLNEHLKSCYFDSHRIPEYIKKIVCDSKPNTDDQTKTLNDEDLSSNNYINFNTKVSLKARLYNKNKTLMENVLSKKKEEKSKEDTLYSFLSNYV